MEMIFWSCSLLLWQGVSHRMRNQSDYIAKHLGKEILAASGTTLVQDAISPETQYADLRHEPDPAQQAVRDRLGLLGRLA